MSLFYDPLQKRTKPWVFVMFIVLPVIFIVLCLIFGGQYAKKKGVTLDEKQLTPQEFFEKFDTNTK